MQDLLNDLNSLGLGDTGGLGIGENKTKPNNVLSALNILDSLCNWRETEIELPMLKIKVLVKPLKGIEELRLRSLKATGETFIRTFNEILFDHLDFQGKVKFKDFEDFISHLGTADKSMLVYGLLFASFTELGDREFECPHCKVNNIYELKPEEMIHNDTIPEKWEKKTLFTDYREDVEIVPGFNIKLGFATEKNSLDILSTVNDIKIEETLADYNNLYDNLRLMVMFIKELKITTQTEEFILQDLKTEILPFILKLKNLNILEKLILKISEKDIFSKYNPNFYVKRNCKNIECGKEFTWVVNPEIEFFRKANTFFGL